MEGSRINANFSKWNVDRWIDFPLFWYAAALWCGLLLEGTDSYIVGLSALILLLPIGLLLRKRAITASLRASSTEGATTQVGRYLLFTLFIGAFFARGVIPGFFGTDHSFALDQQVSAVGRVQSVTEKSLRLTEVRVLEDRVWKAVKESVYIYRDAKGEYDPGDWVGFKGRVTMVDPIVYVSILYPSGAFHYPYRTGPVQQVLSFGHGIANAYAEHVQSVLPAEEAQLAAGIFLGKRFEGDLRLWMNDSGLGHLFVVSGLHFAMLSQIGLILLGFFRVTDPLRTLLVLCFLGFFWIVTGCPASSSRAFLIILFYGLFRMFSYPASGLNLLGAAAILLLLFQPTYARDVGFALSVLATVGIYCGHRFSLRTNGRVSRYLLPLTGAMVFTTPITIAQFARMPFLSIPFNTLFVSSVAMVLLIGLLTSFLCFLLHLPGLSTVFLHGLSPFLRLNTVVLSFLGKHGGTLAVPNGLSIPFWALAAVFFLTALSIKEPVRPTKT